MNRLRHRRSPKTRTPSRDSESESEAEAEAESDFYLKFNFEADSESHGNSELPDSFKLSTVQVRLRLGVRLGFRLGVMDSSRLASHRRVPIVRGPQR